MSLYIRDLRCRLEIYILINYTTATNEFAKRIRVLIAIYMYRNNTSSKNNVYGEVAHIWIHIRFSKHFWNPDWHNTCNTKRQKQWIHDDVIFDLFVTVQEQRKASNFYTLAAAAALQIAIQVPYPAINIIACSELASWYKNARFLTL